MKEYISGIESTSQLSLVVGEDIIKDIKKFTKFGKNILKQY